MFAFGGIKNITKAGNVIENADDIKKITKINDDIDLDASTKIKDFDQNVSNNIYKSVANDINTQEMAETVIRETAEGERRLSRKLTWTEVLALFTRGNNFNAKAKNQQWYPYNEVVLEHPTLKYADGSPKRFRLDSYNANQAIVSRKATTLANIQQSTFESYLRELVNKYPHGSKVIAPSLPINNQLLSGNFILEIPDLNSNFPLLQQYRNIASNFVVDGVPYNITIVLKAE